MMKENEMSFYCDKVDRYWVITLCGMGQKLNTFGYVYCPGCGHRINILLAYKQPHQV